MADKCTATFRSRVFFRLQIQPTYGTMRCVTDTETDYRQDGFLHDQMGASSLIVIKFIQGTGLVSMARTRKKKKKLFQLCLGRNQRGDTTHIGVNINKDLLPGINTVVTWGCSALLSTPIRMHPCLLSFFSPSCFIFKPFCLFTLLQQFSDQLL